VTPLEEFLSATPFFGGLEPGQLALLSKRLKTRDVLAGEAVFRERDQGRSMYVVERGELCAWQTSLPNTRPVKLLRFKEGDFFGETTLIEMLPRPFSVIAEGPARLHELTNMDLYALYREDVSAYVLVLQNINRELCRRLRRAGNRITEIAAEVGDDDGEVTQIRAEGTPRRK
jgi:CRP-like cAMP-binding protein